MKGTDRPRHYFDHAATTPMRQVAQEVWLKYASSLNPGGLYASGREAVAVLATAREMVGEALGCDRIEVIFTGSGTEADNIAIRGMYEHGRGSGHRVVTTPIEHAAGLETIRSLPAADVDYLPVGPDGHVSDLSALDIPAVLASVMWANNETGAIQPISEIAQRAAAVATPVHVDAVQVVGHLPVNFRELGVASLAASAHKFGGPRGVGILLVTRSAPMSPTLTGGGQERGLRSGTNDVAGAIAAAYALQEAIGEMEQESIRLARLTDTLRRGLVTAIPDLVVHTHAPHLPGHLFVSFPGAEADSLIMLFDAAGMEVAAGSACSSGVTRASYVLEAMGVDDATARAAIRFTLGRTTTQSDVDALLAVVPDVVARARLAGMA